MATIHDNNLERLTQHDFFKVNELYKFRPEAVTLIVGNTPIENWLDFEIELANEMDKLLHETNPEN